MEIKLANETILEPIMVTGGQHYVQGENRDTLTFVFPATESIETLDSLFTEENCEAITITDDAGDSYIHKGYGLRCELKKEAVEVVKATEETAAVMEDRIFVSMSQRTYAETQLKKLTADVEMLGDCLIEVGQVVYA